MTQPTRQYLVKNTPQQLPGCIGLGTLHPKGVKYFLGQSSSTLNDKFKEIDGSKVRQSI